MTFRSIARRGAAILAGGALLLVASACGSDSPATAPADCTKIVGDKATVVARNLKWTPTCLELATGAKVAFTLDYQDKNVQHDFELSGQGVHEKTELETGPVQQSLEVDLGKAGAYDYICTIHSQMTGKLYVDEAAGT